MILRENITNGRISFSWQNFSSGLGSFESHIVVIGENALLDFVNAHKSLLVILWITLVL